MSSQLSHWRPLKSFLPEMPSMLNEFNELLRREFPMRAGGNGETWAPKVDLIETPEAYEVRADLPGCKVEDIKVSLAGNTLSIRGERREEERRSEDNVHIFERSHGIFHRSFTLPNAVKGEGVEAVAEDGILTVTVRKSEAAKSREIEVQIKKK
mgnify:CR=1 FL=1